MLRSLVGSEMCIRDRLHDLSHPGVRGSRRLVSERFVWSNMQKDIGAWAEQCLQCQRSKIQRHIHQPTGQIPTPAARFQHVHCDLVGPLPPSSGMTYVLTLIDRFSRWPEAIPLPDIKAETVAQAVISGWVARFGVPQILTTDRGAQFTGSLWSEVCALLTINRSRTTSFHPESNGIVAVSYTHLTLPTICSV